MPNKNLLKAPIIEADLLKKLLPHREPMLMVDALMYYDGIKAEAEFTILNTNIFVNDNQFSETGLMEHMAQSAALMTGYKYNSRNLPVKEGFIATIKNLKIETLPTINDTISTEVEITYEMANMTNVSLISMRNKDLLASAEMTLVLKENE